MSRPESLEPVWLVSHGTVLASAQLATSKSARRRGLIGVSHVTEPLVLEPCSWVHTIGMRTALDLVYLDSQGTVVSLGHIKPWRVGPLTRRAHCIIEAAPGSLEKWNLKVGDTVEVRHVER